jgi:hypothetical protein
VKPTKDPPRLMSTSAGSPRRLRAALASAREDRPRPGQLDRVAARLSATLAVPIPAPTVPTSSSWWTSGGFKIGTVLFVVGASGGGWVYSASEHDAPPTAPAGRSAVGMESPSPVQAVPDAVAVIPPEPAPPGSSRDDAMAAPRPPAAAALPLFAVSPPAAAPPATTDSEIDLLDRAHGVLEDDPATALGWVAKHAHDFPSGELVEEREVIAIQALVSLGRRADAESRIAGFRAVFPRSAFLPRLELLLGESADQK